MSSDSKIHVNLMIIDKMKQTLMFLDNSIRKVWKSTYIEFCVQTFSFAALTVNKCGKSQKISIEFDNVSFFQKLLIFFYSRSECVLVSLNPTQGRDIDRTGRESEKEKKMLDSETNPLSPLCSFFLFLPK